MKKLVFLWMIIMASTSFAAENSSMKLKAYWVGPFTLSRNYKREVTTAQSLAMRSDVELLAAKSINQSSVDTLSVFQESVRQMDNSDLLIADLTHFRGLSAENSTAFSMGYMYGLGKPVFAYTGDELLFFDRIVADLHSDSERKPSRLLARVFAGSRFIFSQRHGWLGCKSGYFEQTGF